MAGKTKKAKPNNTIATLFQINKKLKAKFKARAALEDISLNKLINRAMKNELKRKPL